MLRCSTCHYALTGLPDAGRCPECGTAYGEDEIMLGGKYSRDAWSKGSYQANALNFVFLGVVCCFVAGKIRSHAPSEPMTVGVLLFAGVTCPFLAAAAIHWRWGAAGECIVYLSRQGFGQWRPGQELRRVQPWKKGLEIDFRLAQGRWWLSIRDGLSLRVLARLREDEERVREIREQLEKWQNSRVCVEK